MLILITMRHKDHPWCGGFVSTIWTFMPTEATWRAMGLGKSWMKHIFEMGKMKTFGRFRYRKFLEWATIFIPVFIASWRMVKSFVMLTDTRFMSVAAWLESWVPNAYLIESSHDIEILRSGRPEAASVIQQCGNLILHPPTKITKRIYLGIWAGK